jgi:hypothetical protein
MGEDLSQTPTTQKKRKKNLKTSKWIINLNVEHKPIKLVEDRWQKSLSDPGY